MIQLEINQGFDRNLDYLEIKNKFINEYAKINKELDELCPLEDKCYFTKLRKLFNKSIYLLTAVIQLRNGSRTSEACDAIKLFLINGFDKKVIVKIAKSKTRKYKKDTGEAFDTLTRYRQMKFPLSWINPVQTDNLNGYLGDIKEGSLMKKVLDYLLCNFNCNTHSLRYAFINYMLYTEKKEITIVAKFVGHSNVNQLVRYTQLKESDKMFDMDI